MPKIPVPSSALPPLKRLHAYTASQIIQLLKPLQQLYQPEIRGSKSEESPPDSGYASEASDDEDSRSESSSTSFDALQANQYERAIAMKWSVGFVARAEEWIAAAEEEEEQKDRALALECAASLLAVCSGVATGPLIRTFEFQRDPFNRKVDPIIIYLKDASIDSQDHTSVGLETWGSSCILARRMVQSPSSYGLSKCMDGDRAPRVLELGAGTGLMSMVLAKLLPAAEVVATDYHPAVLENLRANVDRNFPHDDDDGSCAPPNVQPLDWRHLYSLANSDNSTPAALPQPFDLIVGADIVYEPTHALWVKSSVELLLRKPTPSGEESFFYLIMPTRPTHDEETASVPAAFPSAEAVRRARQKQGKILEGEEVVAIAILDVSEIDRMAGTGRMDEVRYLVYKIGWV